MPKIMATSMVINRVRNLIPPVQVKIMRAMIMVMPVMEKVPTMMPTTAVAMPLSLIHICIAHRRCLGQSPQKRETETENKGIRNRKRRKKWQKNLRSKLTVSDKGYMRIKEKGKMTKYTVEKKGHP